MNIQEEYVKTTSAKFGEKHTRKDKFFLQLIHCNVTLFKIKDGVYGAVNGSGRYYFGGLNEK